MRVKAAFIVLMGNQQVAWNVLGHRLYPALPAEVAKEIFHLRFEIQTVPQDQIGPCQCNDVAPRLTVGMRVHARAHQPLHGDPCATNNLSGVGDHACCRDHVQRRGGRSIGCQRGKCCRGRTHKKMAAVHRKRRRFSHHENEYASHSQRVNENANNSQ